VLLIGLDSGGSKTDARLAQPAVDGRLEILGHGLAGPGNPRAVGSEVAGAALIQALSQAMQQAGVKAADVAALCLAVAGAAREAEQQALTVQVRSLGLCCPLRFVHDGWAALAAAHADLVGVALIAGTGSFGFGRNRENLTARVGGWGHLFGDEGSGYWLALRGLQAVARQADGRGAATLLTERVLAHWQLNEPAALIGKLVSEHVDRRQLSQLAPLVLQTAEAQDEVARDLVREAARHLAEHVAALVRQLQLPPAGFPWCVAGGLLVHSPLLQGMLNAHLRELGYDPILPTLVREPVLGALRLALQLAEVTGSSKPGPDE
jgi:N-acetylglucosamine kinase-like BadF-type ATPase